MASSRPSLWLLHFLITSGVNFSCNNRALVVDRYEKKQYVISAAENFSVDSTVYNFLGSFRDSLENTLNKPLASSAEPLINIELSNFVADACFTMANGNSPKSQVDFVVLNRSGLRTTLPKGTITLKNIYELMPFENELVVLKLRGDAVLRLCENLLTRKDEPISGIAIARNQTNNNVDVLVGGIPLDNTKVYFVATSDYLANSSDMFEMGATRTYQKVGIKVRDAIVRYLVALNATGNTLNPSYEFRIKT